MSEVIEVKTIGEVERIVHGSGLWDGTGPVEFSDDGVTWTQAWAPSVVEVASNVSMAVTHPAYARVAVYRKDVRIPTTVTIRWDEQVPAESEEWAEKWHRSPMRHFGRTARMVGFRQTFRDLLGDIVIEDEDRASAQAPDPTARDWAAEIAAADTVEAINKIEEDGRAAKVFKPNAEGTALHRAVRDRRRELEAEAAAAWEPAELAQLAAVTPERAAEVLRVAAQIDPVIDEAIAEAVAEERPGRAPQDYLPPVNRAARRAAAKGRRK